MCAGVSESVWISFCMRVTMHVCFCVCVSGVVTPFNLFVWSYLLICRTAPSNKHHMEASEPDDRDEKQP